VKKRRKTDEVGDGKIGRKKEVKEENRRFGPPRRLATNRAVAQIDAAFFLATRNKRTMRSPFSTRQDVGRTDLRLVEEAREKPEGEEEKIEERKEREAERERKAEEEGSVEIRDGTWCYKLRGGTTRGESGCYKRTPT